MKPRCFYLVVTQGPDTGARLLVDTKKRAVGRSRHADLALTDRGVLPPESKRLSFDPYEDAAATRRRDAFIGFVIAAVAWSAVARVFHLWPF